MHQLTSRLKLPELDQGFDVGISYDPHFNLALKVKIVYPKCHLRLAG